MSIQSRVVLAAGLAIALSAVNADGGAFASASSATALSAVGSERPVHKGAETADLPFGLTSRDLRSFDAAMQKISEAASVTIVAEAVPFRAELTDDEATALEEALLATPNGSTIAKITLVARAYDYDIERAGSGSFLLHKHHSDPADLPDVTYDEVVRSLDSLLKLVDVYARTPAVTSVDPSAFQLYESLTLEQQAKAHSDGGLTLTLADLNPAQKELALEAAQHTVLDNRTNAVLRALQHLTALHGKNVNFLWTTRTDQGVALARNSRNARTEGSTLLVPPADRENDPVFEYVIPYGQSDYNHQFPLNHGLRIYLSGGGLPASSGALVQAAPELSQRRADRVSGQSTSGTAAGTFAAPPESGGVGGRYDPTEPTPQDRRLASGMMSDKLASTVTLEGLAKSLSSAKSGAGASGGLRITIDPALYGKPVTVFGGHLVSGNQLIRLAARVYGLQISTADNKAIYITTPKVQPVHGVSDLQAEIKRVIPPSLLCTMESQIDRISEAAPRMPGLPAERSVEDREKFAAILTEQARSTASISAADSWYFLADRRLFLLATAAVPALGSPPVSVASLGPEPSRLIALMSLADGGMVAMRKLLNFVPPLCLTDTSTMRIVLTCHETATMQGVGIRFASVDSSGTVKHEGMSSFGRPKPK